MPYILLFVLGVFATHNLAVPVRKECQDNDVGCGDYKGQGETCEDEYMRENCYATCHPESCGAVPALLDLRPELKGMRNISHKELRAKEQDRENKLYTEDNGPGSTSQCVFQQGGGNIDHAQLSSNCDAQGVSDVLKLSATKDMIHASSTCAEVEVAFHDNDQVSRQATETTPTIISQPVDTLWSIDNQWKAWWTIPWHSEYLRATCNGKTLRAVKAIQNGTAIIEPKSLLRSEYDFNIVLMKIESTSRSNFFKYMPETAALVKNYGECGTAGQTHCSFVFNRYAGAHGQTLQCLMAAFAGRKYDLLNVELHSRFGGILDHEPEARKTEFIWEYARRYGYRSAYAAPANVFMGSTQPQKSGILSTFDHPGNTMHVKTYSEFDAAVGSREYCVDGHAPAEFQVEYIRSFDGLKFKRTISIMDFMDAHSSQTRFTQPDEHMAWYIRKTLTTNPNSVVVLFSDHGNSLDFDGSARPLLSLFLPKWFLEVQPQIYSTLMENQYKLVNHYSLWHTLKHLVSFPGSDLQTTTENTPPGTRSLFEAADTNMTCKDLWIPLEWCPCIHWETVNLDYITNDKLGAQIGMVEGILQEINSDNQQHKNTTCMMLTLVNVYQMRFHQQGEDPDSGHYIVMFHTKEAFVSPDLAMMWSVTFTKQDSHPQVNIMSFKMVYSYAPYGVCRDNRINPHKCACDTSLKSIRGPFESQ